MNKIALAVAGVLAVTGGGSARAEEVADVSDSRTLAVDLRTGVREVNSDQDIWPITWSSQWGGGAAPATVTSAYDASVTEVPDEPTMPGDAPSQTLVNAQTGEGEAAFVSLGSGLYKLTHTPGGETAWFLLKGTVSPEETVGTEASVTLAFDGRVFTAENPRPVEDLADVWEIAYSGKNWNPAAADGTATLALNSSNGSVTLKSTTGDGDYTLDQTADGDATLTHTVGDETMTAYLRFASAEPPAPATVKIDTDGDNVPDTEVLACGGASWLDTDGSGEGGEGSETGSSPLLITGIDPEETENGLRWRISFRPRLKGGTKNLEAWYRASQLNGMICLRRAGTRSGLDEVTATVAEGEIKQPVEGGVPEEVILTKEAIDGNRILWQVEVK